MPSAVSARVTASRTGLFSSSTVARRTVLRSAARSPASGKPGALPPEEAAPSGCGAPPASAVRPARSRKASISTAAFEGHQR
ncbi:hypothetical protein SCALM49S_06130 [Streptomyces californicus]